MERTFIMVKPDGVQRGLVGEIIQRFERKGYKLIAVKMIHASEQLLQTHYEALKSLPFFTNLVAYMSSGPVVPMVFEGRKAVENGRTMLGATRPEASCPGSIRGDFCQDVGRNVVHGSDSVESANREINLWFSPQELCRYEQGINTWIHE